MKKIFSLIVMSLMVASVFAQNQLNEIVTITVTGNKVTQIEVDNKVYLVSNKNINEEQAIVIKNLEEGLHYISISKTSTYNRISVSKTSFTLRNGYDLAVNINANGSVRLTEKIIEDDRISGIPVSTAVFNKLYAAVKKIRSSVSRSNYLENEFVSTSKKFTANQASSLIKLVNSESYRLKLAKQVYTRVTDIQNFSLVSYLLNSQANRSELDDYIASVTGDDTTDDTIAFTPISNQQFQVIYNEVKNEQGEANKNYYLKNFFGKDYNFYTSLQAKQLIELISSEEFRFGLSKNAYRGITDRENYNTVYQLINSPSKRIELTAFITTHENDNIRPGMKTEDFDKLYKATLYQNSVNGRYNSILNAFTLNGNSFTVAQAKQLVALVNDESLRLNLIKTVYQNLGDRSNYTQFYELLNLQASRYDVQTYVQNYYNSVYETGTGIAMSDTDYNKLYRTVNDSWSTSVRYNQVETAFNSTINYFTSTQVRQLLLLITGETERLGLAKNAYDNITDRDNFKMIYDIFSSATSKNELAIFTGDKSFAISPMSDSEFNSMYRSIQFTFGFGAKMSALTDIFNKETNYFTVDQTKQLIQLVSAEYNRLELAKAAFNNVTDPANYTNIYDIFSSQSSKDELDAFIKNNGFSNK